MPYFAAKTEHVGGFMVRAEYLHGDITVNFVSGRGIQATESFTAEESKIHTRETLQSYCEARMAQWRRLKWQRVA